MDRPGCEVTTPGRAVGNARASSIAHERIVSGARQSPACVFAMALAGNPRASGSSRPPKVTCLCAPTRSIRFSTCLVGGMTARAAASSSGPLEKNQTGTRRNAFSRRDTNRRAAGCQRFACNAPPTITASNPVALAASSGESRSTRWPSCWSVSASIRPMPSVSPRFDPHVMSTRMTNL